MALLNPELITVDYVGALYRQHASSQLATTKLVDRTRGHACLMQRMAAAFFERPSLLAQHGEPLFWCTWTALVRARVLGVGWNELETLANYVGQIVRQGPASVARTRIGRTVSLLGARRAVALEGAISGRKYFK
ncbi:MAG: hypothetical protein QM736_21195 [Vicinamibacterales bacterium]